MSTDSLSHLWNSDLHYLQLGVLFPEDGCNQIILDWEELEEEDELSPFESPSRTPILSEPKQRSDNQKKLFPLRDAEQAWGELSVVLTAFAHVVGCTKEQYELVWPGQSSVQDEVRWSFQTKEFVTERM